MLKYARILIGLWSRSFGGRRIDDPTIVFFYLLSNQTSMLSLVCTVTDHIVRQNVVGPSVKNFGAQLSVSSVYRGKLTSDVIIQTGVNQCEI